ncbi:protein translocase subunit SecD [Saccharopolyspora phatthalungensis]|uniref:Protein translocase subunit SecD n=1 Tax=Saccharopolyspora phatthalungensis TaxID=664693 RepID=A0A840Q204_9PSEU|nr:protein translocase subunit SecD [Saccharopolyspora phatthalungensis]MBB5152808.1 preprotein translocase subunit SecD [Saccharopolyspora phatthalungensis]
MAPPAGQFRPGRYLAFFALIVIGLYALVFFTGDGKPNPKLGIDLQGGTRVTLTARTPDGRPPTTESLNQARQIIETRVNGMGISGSEVTRDGNNLVITVPGEGGEQAKQLGQTAELNFRKVINAVPAAQPPAGTTPQAARQQGGDDKKAIDEAKALRQSTDPKVQMQALQTLNCAAEDPLRGNDDPKLPLVTCDREGQQKYLLEPVFLPGKEIANSQAQPPNPQGGHPGWAVALDFKSEGAKIWADFTSANVGQQAAFVLDTEVVSAPSVNTAMLGGNALITGQFNQQTATDLANILKYGSLPLAFDQSEAETVSATLGVASLEAGLIAGGLGLLLVAVYCLFYYRLLGILTILSLALSGGVVYGVLVLLGRWVGFTLDLAGVAGFIVAIGITADSFIVFFERLKDEIREGRTFRSAVPRAWPRARRTILSADAVSFLAAAVLYILAVGQVKGFAFTLGMSTVLDLVVVFLVTHPLVALASKNKFLSKPSVSGLGAVQRLSDRYRAARKAAATTAKEA